MNRKKIQFFGDVQGVGFRYTACSVAQEFNVTGYVRNIRNGSVELVVEGKPKEIDRFLETLHDRMSDHIDREEVVEELASGEFIGFSIR